MSRRKKHLRWWKMEDFVRESARIQRDTDLWSDGVLCGAMMLAALREGTSLRKLAAALETTEKRLEVWHSALMASRVFTKRRIRAEWFEKGGGISFMADVCVGLGFMERTPAPAV